MKFTYTPLTSLTNESAAVNRINTNFASLQAVIETLLSRNGASPNQAESTLDMNSNRVVNLPRPVDPAEPVRLQDIDGLGDLLDVSEIADQVHEDSITASDAATSATSSAAAAAASAAEAAGFGNPGFASSPQAIAGTATDKMTSPARVRDFVQSGSWTVDAMNNAETFAAIVNRTGLTPQMLGALSSDSDHSSAINAAVSRLVTNGGGTLWLPPISGDWKVGSTIQIHNGSQNDMNLKILGTGRNTRLKWLGTTGDLFEVGNGTTPVYFVEIGNLHTYTAGTRVSGRDFYCRLFNICNFHDIVTEGTYEGFYCDTVNSAYWDRVIVNMPNYTTGRGFYFYANYTVGHRSDIAVLNEVTVQAYNKGSYGMVIDGASNGIHVNGGYMLGTERGLWLTSGSSLPEERPQFCHFRKFETDRAKNHSVVLDQGYHIEFERCELSNTSGAVDDGVPQGGADGDTVFIDTPVEEVVFLGGRISDTQACAMTTKGSNVTVLGTTFGDASKSGVGNSPTIYVGPGAYDTKFIGCTLLGYSRASYGILVDAAASYGMADNISHKDFVSGGHSGDAGGTFVFGTWY